ncbi:hypothetical protein SAMN04488542_102277 [Fontibacillus panacisegetis]|uniref:Uncharacterized protein n=1 Tax=Fontibacillus panacisegetis TaxID=670482 RepID=A0A1G7G3D1_9BACL|nr:hypothetical protein [Fontibacillus panacisegetis]SDE82595.1 hypothetical protein SAMN04488542_102277 [Fontibacillus panacisegetis]
MTKNQNKKLTASGLKSLESNLNERKTIFVYGGQFAVTISVVFRESMIENVLKAYLSILNELQEHGEGDEDLIRGSLGIFNTLVLREFTDLPIPKSNDLNRLITVTNTLLDTGIMKEVYDAISPQQLLKIEEKLKSVQSNFDQVVKTIE